jgi:hypothetical protein
MPGNKEMAWWIRHEAEREGEAILVPGAASQGLGESLIVS